MQGVIDQHMATGNPGRFKIIETPESVVVVPTARRKSVGTWVPDASPLDLRVTFPELDREIDGALQALCNALRASWGSRAPKLYCLTNLRGMRTVAGAKDEVARDVLVRLIANARWSESSVPIIRLAWTFGPGSQVNPDTIFSLFQVMQVPERSSDRNPIFRNGPLNYRGLFTPPAALP